MVTSWQRIAALPPLTQRCHAALQQACGETLAAEQRAPEWIQVSSTMEFVCL